MNYNVEEEDLHGEAPITDEHVQNNRTILFHTGGALNIERFFSCGIAEADMTGIAAGFAASGKTPFISTFAIFMTGRAYDQIRNSIAYPKMNVKIVATHARLTVGEDGATHQSVEDLGLMLGIPNMVVIAPADAVETADLLAAEGIAAKVINVLFIKPFDSATILASVQKTGAIVTAEEHSIINGLGSAVAELLAEQYPAPLLRVGINDTFGESGKPDALLEKYGLTTAHIVQAAKEALARK